jgi:hypothetical protein
MQFNIPLSKEDLYSQGKNLAVVAAGLSAAGLASRLITYKTRKPIQLSIPDMDAIYQDYDLVQALKVMEHWSKLNPFYYEQLVVYLDNMLTIERGILTKETFPTQKSLDIAYQHFRLAVKYLTDFKETILQYCGTDDVHAFKPFQDIVYARAQEHFLQILHKCRKFDARQYLQHTQQRIDQIIATHQS